MLDFIENLDRRYVFVLIALSVALPLIFKVTLPMPDDPQVKTLYDYIENLKPGSQIAISFDYDPSSEPELHPMAIALLHHAFRKKHKVLSFALYPAGPSMANDAFAKVVKHFPEVEYGKDYINLGFYYGPNTGLNQVAVFCSDILRAFPKDEKKKVTGTYPIMSGFRSLKDAAVVISLSAGDPGVPAYVSEANAKHGINVAAGVTAVSAPRFYAYYNSGQLMGLLGGLGGAASYESFVKVKGKALAGMGAQSFAHLVIILLIIISNGIYLIRKRSEEPRWS
jgi:hypothetical protein